MSKWTAEELIAADPPSLKLGRGLWMEKLI
jgi:hypothetical protein